VRPFTVWLIPPPPLCATAPPSLRRTLRGDPRPPSPLAPPSGSPRSVKSRPEFGKYLTQPLPPYLSFGGLLARTCPGQWHGIVGSWVVVRLPFPCLIPCRTFFSPLVIFLLSNFHPPSLPVPHSLWLLTIWPDPRSAFMFARFSLSYVSFQASRLQKYVFQVSLFFQQLQFFSQPSLYTCQFV